MKKSYKLFRTILQMLILNVCFLPLIVNGQEKSTVNFVTAKTWQEVLLMAKQHQKPIFIDAMATWCSPCKKMDQEVYTSDNVAAYMNANFISVKIQMDKTEKDSELVKGWYTDAEMLLKKYQIEAFPTFLYLDFNGNLLDIESGYIPAESFITSSKKAIDPDANYAGQIQRFNTGRANPNSLLDLALKARKNKQDSLSARIAKAYKELYLDRQDPKEVLFPSQAAFLAEFRTLFNVNDPLIQYLSSNALEADRKFQNPGFSQRLTDYLIRDYYITNKVWPNKQPVKDEPQWVEIENEIIEKYGEGTAKRLISSSKLKWYQEKKDWDKIIALNIEKVDAEGIDTTTVMGRVGINNMVYEVIFKHSNKKEELLKGIKYINVLLKYRPHAYRWIDTYAALLYKIGDKKAAIKQQEKALSLAMKENDKTSVELYLDNIKKMKNSQPTWL